MLKLNITIDGKLLLPIVIPSVISGFRSESVEELAGASQVLFANTDPEARKRVPVPAISSYLFISHNKKGIVFSVWLSERRSSAQDNNIGNNMPQYAFGAYRFDAETFQLWKNKSSTRLRPKAAELLALFILHKGHVLSKTTIAKAIWKQESVPDHTLFQLISELRKLSPTTIIRTLPNQGYCWIAPTKAIKKHTYRSAILALCTAASIASLILISSHIIPPYNAAPLPGHKAFLNGLVALERGNNKNATSWLTFALTENPTSVETRLFLAESLFQQNRLEESISYLTPILRQNIANPIIVSPYNKAAANNLMSRIYHKDGKLLDALDYAQQSNLGQTIAHCTEGVISQRVELLANILGISQAPETTAILTTSKTKKLNNDEHYAEQCSQLKALRSEPSACQYSNSVELYALSTLNIQRRRIS